QVVEERRGIRVPAGPDAALVVDHLRNFDEPPLRLVQLLVISLFKEGHADELAVGAIAPAVIGAGEHHRAALVVAADLHAAVTAGIQEHVNLALAVAHQDHGLLAHPRDEEIARIGDLAFVPDEQPGAGENQLQLLLVNIAADENFSADSAVLEVYVAVTSAAHHEPSPSTTSTPSLAKTMSSPVASERRRTNSHEPSLGLPVTSATSPPASLTRVPGSRSCSMTYGRPSSGLGRRPCSASIHRLRQRAYMSRRVGHNAAMRVGLIGTGNMGNRFGSKILRGEHELLVYDLRRESSAALCDAGARWIDGPAAVASEAEVIITSLPSPSAVERVTLGSDGLVNLMPRGA